MQKRSTSTRSIALSALFCAVIIITSFISIPVFAIPITLQLFGVYVALYLLGGKLATISCALYVCLGALGLPVFAGFSGGLGRLFDATGGFIFGFLTICLTYWLITSLMNNSRLSRIVATSVSLVVFYLMGSIWYSVVYLGGISHIWSALLATVLPFIIPDVLKISVAYYISGRDLFKRNLHNIK